MAIALCPPPFITKMSQCHESHDHDHSHELTSDLGSQDNLFLHIDRDNVVALNTSGSGSVVIKPWHARLDETQVADEYLFLDRNN